MDCSGLGVAIVTPFKEDGSLDEPALRKLARYLVENGVDYIVALGTTGESVTQTLQERLRMLEVLFEEVHGEVRIVIGAGGMTRMLLRRRCSFMGGISRRRPFYR